jgi:hypothetical protein
VCVCVCIEWPWQMLAYKFISLRPSDKRLETRQQMRLERKKLKVKDAFRVMEIGQLHRSECRLFWLSAPRLIFNPTPKQLIRNIIILSLFSNTFRVYIFAADTKKFFSVVCFLRLHVFISALLSALSFGALSPLAFSQFVFRRRRRFFPKRIPSVTQYGTLL